VLVPRLSSMPSVCVCVCVSISLISRHLPRVVPLHQKEMGKMRVMTERKLIPLMRGK